MTYSQTPNPEKSKDSEDKQLTTLLAKAVHGSSSSYAVVLRVGIATIVDIVIVNELIGELTFSLIVFLFYKNFEKNEEIFERINSIRIWREFLDKRHSGIKRQAGRDEP